MRRARGGSSSAVLLVLVACHASDHASPGDAPLTSAPDRTPPSAPSAPATSPSARAERDASAAADARVEAGAPLGALCFPPHRGPFDPCPKGAAASEAALAACLRRAAEKKAPDPRFRVGDGAWLSFSPVRWRCVGVPVGTATHVTVDTIAGFDARVPKDCPSRALDMQGPNTYGAVFFRCSTRDRSGDEALRP